MTYFEVTIYALGIVAALWLAMRLLGDALAWWAMITREEGDLFDEDWG